jgi:hypothetical protein
MEPALASALKNQWPWVKDVFTSDFRTPNQWVQYISGHFGGGTPSVGRILNKTQGWTAEDFQALYIACWILHPVEKGTFMIQLTPAQRTNARAGYSGLDSRWTSHLHKHGRSAAKDWHFLKGYHELLVQMEGGGKHTAEAEPHLFLKCEGHTAFNVMHLKSYYTKVKTGKGDVANARLQELARKKEQLGLGITERAAENYSKEYKALLKTMGFSGKTITVHQAGGRMFALCQAAMRQRPGIKPSLDSLLTKAGLPILADEQYVVKMRNVDLAVLLKKVLLPFAHGLGSGQMMYSSPQTQNFTTALRNAEPDILQMATQLEADAALTNKAYSQRYFQEVVLDPSIIDEGLQVAVDLLA